MIMQFKGKVKDLIIKLDLMMWELEIGEDNER